MPELRINVSDVNFLLTLARAGIEANQRELEAIINRMNQQLADQEAQLAQKEPDADG